MHEHKKDWVSAVKPLYPQRDPRQGMQPSGELTRDFRPMILGSDPSWENSLTF